MKNSYQHLLTHSLEKVKKVLHKREDAKILTRETFPPNSDNTEGQKRVIDIRKKNANEIIVIWCYENYY